MQDRIVTDAAVKKQTPSNTTLLPWIIWGLSAAFFFIEYFARVAPEVMIPQLMNDFSINAATVGQLSAFFYYAYVSIQIPVGVAIDQYGPRRLLIVTTIICAVGSCLFATATTWQVAIFSRFLIGFGAAFAFVSTIKLAANWFPAKKFGLLAGLTQAIGMIGAASGVGPLSITVSTIGWRHTILLIGALFIVLSLLISLIVRDKPSQGKQTKQRHTFGELWEGLKIALSNKQTWYNALFAAFLYGPTGAFAEFWGSSFLKSAYHLTKHQAAFGISLIFIGLAIGGPFAGLISDKIQRRKPILIFSAISSGILFSFIVYSNHLPILTLYGLLFGYGIANTAVCTTYAIAHEINPRKVAATSVAFTNMASVLLAANSLPIIGLLLDYKARLSGAGPDTTLSAENFHFALNILPLCFIVCIILIFFIKETYCKPYELQREGKR